MIGFIFDNFFKFNDPTYKLGYQEGFKDAKEEVMADLKVLMKKLETLEAYRTSTSTGSIKIKLRHK